MNNAIKYKLEIAEPKHLTNLAQLVNSAYRGEFSKKGWTTEADFLDGQRTDPEALLETIQSSDQRILLFFDDCSPSVLLGCVLIRRINNLAYLGMLTVRPDIQSSGLGRAILKEAELKALELWNPSRIEMTVIDRRSELIAWYERRGYELTGERRPFPYGNDRFGIPKTSNLEFVVLTKSLHT